MKNHIQFVALISSAISVSLLAGCETNPAVGNFVKRINDATTPTSNTTQPSAPLAQNRAEVPARKAESQVKTAENSREFVADKRVESTGLLGKTLTSKIKYSKSWHGEVPFFNAYMAFIAIDGNRLPKNTNILNLRTDTTFRKKEIFAFVKGNATNAYFIDMLEVDLPKGYTAQSFECKGGDIGLFNFSSTDSTGNYVKPVKAWSVVNGRFVQITNINKMTCVDADGDGV